MLKDALQQRDQIFKTAFYRILDKEVTLILKKMWQLDS